jgi:hypothetical protein
VPLTLSIRPGTFLLGMGSGASALQKFQFELSASIIISWLPQCCRICYPPEDFS